MNLTNGKMNGLDLFSGYGGITLALEPWVRPIAYCEIERYAQGILLSRMASGDLPLSPIWDNVTTFDGKPWRNRIDIIYGGFPCQDISVAGNGAGLAGKRSGLFHEICRLAEEIQPSFIFLENVPAIRTRGLDTVIEKLTALGYDLRWTTLSAQEVGAPHRRERWFLLAYSNGEHVRLEQQRKPGGLENRVSDKRQTVSRYDGSEKSLADAPGKRIDERVSEIQGLERAAESDECGNQLADANGSRLEVGEPGEKRELASPFGKNWWSTEPDVGRVVNGCPLRVDRIKALGNGVVPAQARQAFKELMGIKWP